MMHVDSRVRSPNKSSCRPVPWGGVFMCVVMPSLDAGWAGRVNHAVSSDGGASVAQSERTQSDMSDRRHVCGGTPMELWTALKI
jgi:hypothetical protein